LQGYLGGWILAAWPQGDDESMRVMIHELDEGLKVTDWDNQTVLWYASWRSGYDVLTG